ncbi:MAG: hypothetical protein IJ151_06550, partial [Bacteroidales bacterium]|nr:hypothetical protein [Bacteroidales bacterium]
KISTFTPEEKAKYESDMTTERDIRNYISFAEEKGEKRGREEGLKEGLKEGLEAGKKEGIKEGAINAKIEIARNMLVKGLDVETIASYTSLSVDKIEELNK